MSVVKESTPIARHLKSNSGKQVISALYTSEPMLGFIENHIDTIYPVKQGKQGLWIFSGEAMPVVVYNAKETSVTLKKPDGKPWEELFNNMPVFDDPGVNSRLILPNEKAKIYNWDDAKIFINYMAYAFLKSNEQDLDSFVSRVLHQNNSNLDSWTNNKDLFKSTNADITDVSVKTSNKNKRKNRSNNPGGEGTTFINFDDGWQWLDLGRDYCAIEGDAAGHCGNANPKSGDNILSLRDSDNRIHMTVVVDDSGYTTEMKAPGNRKPANYTHPYVVELLLNDQIKGVGGGRYLPENDFKVTDLNMQLASKLSKAGKMGDYDDVMDCAIKANGNQQLFAKLIVGRYGLQDFQYGFDYDKQAILLDSAPIDSFIDDYDLTIAKSSNYDSWTENLKADDLKFLWSEDSNAHECGSYIALAWHRLPNSFKEGIWSTISNDPLPDHSTSSSMNAKNVAIGLRAAAKQNKNTAEGLLRVGNKAKTDTNLESFNNENRATAYYDDGYYVNASQNKTMHLYISSKGADQQLKSNKTIELPESISTDYTYVEDVGLDQLLNALRSHPFWAKKFYTDKGEDWSQELDKDQGQRDRQIVNAQRQKQLAAANQHPMQIYVRNEQEILPKLEQAYMYGGLKEYIQQLQQLGWWDDYVDWATQNNRFLPVEAL